MRTLDLDWDAAFEQLEEWQRLSFDAQALLLSGPTTGSLPVGELNSRLVEELVSTGWFELVESQRRVQKSESRRELLRALRAMVRAPALHAAADDGAYRRRDAEGTSLDNYLIEHGTREDLERLGGLAEDGRLQLAARLASSSWVLAFLERQRGALSKERSARYSRVDERVLEQSDRLIRLLLGMDEPLALSDAYDAFVGDGREASDQAAPENGVASVERRQLFADTLHFVLREVLVLISLDDELRPFLGIWPATSRTIQRRRAAEDLQLDLESSPEQQWSRPQLVDDLLVLLTECASDPPRVKANRRELFARSNREIAERLAPVPDWLAERDFGADLEQRLHRAVGTALGFGFVDATGKAGRDLRLVVSSQGRDWMAAEPVDRMLTIYRRYRDDDSDPENASYEEGEEGEDLEQMRSHIRLLPHRPYHYYLWNVDFETPTFDAFRQLEVGRWVDIQHFLQQRAVLNPIEEQLSPERLQWIGEQQVQRIWFHVLAAFLFDRLVVLGAAAFGLVGGRLVFALRPASAFLLSTSDGLEWEPEPLESRVIVQPNFEIVFLEPSMEAAHEVARIAETLPAWTRGERVGTLFELTRASVQRAASGGESTESLLAALRRVAAQDLPRNVEQQLVTWCEQLHWARPKRLLVLECETVEGAALALGALGKSARLLSETLVGVEAKSLSESARRKLRKAGVYLRESD